MSGVNYNDRQETASIRNEFSTRHVVSLNDLPAIVSEEGELEEDIRYVFDERIIYAGYMKVPAGSASVLKGDGTGANGLDVQGIRTVAGFTQLSVTDLRMTGDGTTDFFDVTGNTGMGPGGGLLYVAGTTAGQALVGGYSGIGQIQNCAQVVLRSIDFLGNVGSLTLTGNRQQQVNDCFFTIGPPGPAPTFAWLTVMGSTATREIIIRASRFATLPTVAALYISPLLPTGSVQIFDNTKITAPGLVTDFFQAGETGEITSYADAGGGFVTCSTANTGALVNGDIVNILRSENYGGGYAISNVVANTSFDIEATFVADDTRGTWDSGSLNQKDPRVLCTGNIGVPDSQNIAAGFVNANTQATLISAADTWTEFVMDGFTDAPILIERFALTGDGEAGKFVYLGNAEFSGFLIASLIVVAVGGGAALDTYEFGVSVNDADPFAGGPLGAVTDLNSLTRKPVELLAAVRLNNGDTFKPVVRCVGDTRDILIEYASIVCRG